MEKNPKFEDFELSNTNVNDVFMLAIKFYRETKPGYDSGKPYNKN